jgi:hypothetical protein
LPLFGKQLTDILEGFKLQRIAGGVEEEHRCLFAREAFEPDIGFDNEFDGLLAQSVFQGFPVCPFQYDAKVRDGYIVSIYGVCVEAVLLLGAGFPMDDELMTEKIEVDPGIGASSFFASEYIAVE